MRKLFLLFVGLMFFTGSTWAQEITIGTGEADKFIPIDPAWNYSYSQMIYLQSEIDTEGNITTLQFYYNGTPSSLSNSNDWDIYLGHTDKSFFEGGSQSTDWISTSDMTQVFSGIITGSKAAWITITLDTPFAYNNIDNLVIAVDENTTGYNLGNANYFHCTETEENRSIRYVTDGANPNPNSPPSASNTQNAYANVKLTIGEVSPAIPNCATNPSPDGVTNVSIYSTLSWDSGDGDAPTGYRLYFGTDGGGIDTPVNLANGLEGTSPYTPVNTFSYNTTYYWQVVPYNTAGDATGCPIWSFATDLNTGINKPAAAAIHAYISGGLLYLETPSREAALVNVYDITGQLVLQGKTGGNSVSSLNASALSNGIYVVNVMLNTGIVSQKVSVQK